MHVGNFGSDVRRKGERIIAVSLAPQTKRLKAHEEEEGSKGVQCGPKISQELSTKLERECNRSKSFREDQTVITLRGTRNRREFSTAGPVKFAEHESAVKLPMC